MHKFLVFMVMAWVVALSVDEINAQTFQYSRGWTNGKRSSVSVTEMPPRQMMPVPIVQVLTANDLSNRER